MEISNEKQKAWSEALINFNRNEIIMVETGRIRNPNWKNSDGDSTNFFSKNVLISKIYSIDNDSENFSGFGTSEDYCKNTLSKEQLDKVIFMNGNSTDLILELPENQIDLVFLDSANDSELIYNEFISILSKLKDSALVIVDDVTLPGVKGDKILNLLDVLNVQYFKKIANPADCAYFFIDTDLIKKIKEYTK
jgi:hypothetical protein